MEIFNHSQAGARGGRGGSRPGRCRDASGKIFKDKDGHIKMYATVSRDGDFGKIQRALFAKDNGGYFLIANERGSKMVFLHKDQKKQQTKMMLRLICDTFPHDGSDQWFLGDFTDETQTKIKLTFDK